MKKLKFFFSHYNVFWALPLLFITMVLVWYKLPSIYPEFGTYDPAMVPGAILQMLVAAVAIFGAAKMGLWFSLRTIEKYLFGKEQPKDRKSVV